MSFDLYQITFAIALLMLGLEIFTGTFLFLGFSIALALLAVLHFFTAAFSFGRDVALVAVIAAISFFFLRKFFHKSGDALDASEDVNKY